MRSRNTDIRAIQVAPTSPDASDSFSASNKPFFEWLDALESSGLALDDYANAVCPEMSGNSLWDDTWVGSWTWAKNGIDFKDSWEKIRNR